MPLRGILWLNLRTHYMLGLRGAAILRQASYGRMAVFGRWCVGRAGVPSTLALLPLRREKGGLCCSGWRG